MSTFYETPKRSDEIYHYFYKRKYKSKSGKWVYVYDDGSLSKNGEYSVKSKHTTQNGNTVNEITQHKTNTKRWLDKTDSEITVSTKNGKSVIKDKKTVEHGKLTVMKNNLRRYIAPSPQDKLDSQVRGAKATAKFLKKNVPKAVKGAKKVYKAVTSGDAKREIARRQTRRAFNR